MWDPLIPWPSRVGGVHWGMPPTWSDICRRLDHELMSLWIPSQVESWHEFGNTGQSSEAVEQDLALGDIPFLEEVAQAVETWTRTDLWPELSTGGRYCLRLRLNAAADFVHLLPQGIGLPEAMTEREIVRIFLLEWWPSKGRGFFAREICSS